MPEIVLSNQFKKDLKLAAKRGYKLNLLEETVDKIASNIKPEDKYRDHAFLEYDNHYFFHSAKPFNS